MKTLIKEAFTDMIRDLLKEGTDIDDIANQLISILNTTNAEYKEEEARRKAEEAKRLEALKIEAVTNFYENVADIAYIFTGEKIPDPTEEEIQKTVKDLETLASLVACSRKTISKVFKEDKDKDPIETFLNQFVRNK